MLYIKDDGTIRLTRGDTARLTIPIINSASNDEYAARGHNELETLLHRQPQKSRD